MKITLIFLYHHFAVSLKAYDRYSILVNIQNSAQREGIELLQMLITDINVISHEVATCYAQTAFFSVFMAYLLTHQQQRNAKDDYDFRDRRFFLSTFPSLKF